MVISLAQKVKSSLIMIIYSTYLDKTEFIEEVADLEFFNFKMNDHY